VKKWFSARVPDVAYRGSLIRSALNYANLAVFENLMLSENVFLGRETMPKTSLLRWRMENPSCPVIAYADIGTV